MGFARSSDKRGRHPLSKLVRMNMVGAANPTNTKQTSLILVRRLRGLAVIKLGLALADENDEIAGSSRGFFFIKAVVTWRHDSIRVNHL